MSKTVDINLFRTVHHTNLRNNRYSLSWYLNRCEPFWIVAKPPQHIYYAYIFKDRKSGSYEWQLFRIVSDSSCHARLLLLNSITGFINSKIAQTNSANQNLHGRKFGSLLCRLILQTRFAVFLPVWAQFVLSETTKCFSVRKQPLMRGDWKRVRGKLFFTALKVIPLK